MPPKEELTLPSGAKTLLKLGALAGIAYVASRKLPEEHTAAQHFEAGAMWFSRGYLIGIGIIGVFGIIGLIELVIAGLGGD